MSGFVKRTRSVNTVNPAGGINPAMEPNVGQYGWTKYDSANVNQIQQYVDMCKQYAQESRDAAEYVALRFNELRDFMVFIEKVYEEINPIYQNILPIYDDIKTRHKDIATRHSDIIRISGLVETNSIAAKDSAAAALVSQNSSAASANAAKVSETNAAKSAKDAADIAEELRKGQVYRGTWNIESNNSFPPKPDTNSVWDITLNEDSLEFFFAGEKWYWGDRLLYLKDEDKFSQIESGSTVISVNGKGGAVTLNAADVGAVTKHHWVAKVKLGTWSAIGTFYNKGLGGKAVVTVGMTRNSFVSNARFLISWGHDFAATITQLESHKYSQIKVRLCTINANDCQFEIMDNSYDTTPEGTEVEYLCEVHELFGQLDKLTSFTASSGTPASTVTTEYKAIKIDNNKVFHQGFLPTSSELNVVNRDGDTMKGTFVPVRARKGAVIMEDKASIMYRDSSSTWFHNFTEGNEMRWSVGQNAENQIASLSSAGEFVAGRFVAAGDGIAFRAPGGYLHTTANSTSLNSGTHAFITAPHDVSLCHNNYYDGSSWAKYDNSRFSGTLVANLHGLSWITSEPGSTNPLQNHFHVYTSGNKPTPADIGAVSSESAGTHVETQPYSLNVSASKDDGSSVGGWARSLQFSGGLTSTNKFHMGALGENDNLSYGFLSIDNTPNTFEKLNALRIYPDYVAWGNHKIYHEGNKPNASDFGGVPVYTIERTGASVSAVNIFKVWADAGSGSSTFSFLISGGSGFGGNNVPLYKVAVNTRGDTGSGAPEGRLAKVTSLEGSDTNELTFYLVRNGAWMEFWVERNNFSSQMSVVPLVNDSSGVQYSYPLTFANTAPIGDGRTHLVVSTSYTSHKPPTANDVGAANRGIIVNGTDLNIYHTNEHVGIWGVLGGNNNGWPWNNVSPGSLLVESVNNIAHQTASRGESFDTLKRWRNSVTGEWSAWVSVYNSNYRPAFDNWAHFGETPLNVSGCLAWRNFGNNHVIFDASSGVAPTGAIVDNKNPTHHWDASFPTLMGWNGSDTYGVRVDSARQSDFLLAPAGHKSAIDLPEGASIRFRQGDGAWLHQYAVNSGIQFSHGGSGENFIASLDYNGHFTTKGAQYGTQQIAQSSNGTTWLGIESSETTEPFISFKAPGMADTVKGISFTNQEFFSHRDLASHSFRVGADAGLKFSPNVDLSGVTWGVGINPDNRSLGFHMYNNGAWTGAPIQIGTNSVTTFTGPVNTGGATSIGGDLTTAGAAIFNGGYARVDRGTNPTIEWHAPGKHAWLGYVPDNGGLIMGHSNGSGFIAHQAVHLSKDGNHFSGRINVGQTQGRAWSGIGIAAFHQTQTDISGEGNLHGLVTGRYHYPGYYELEMGLGSIHYANSDNSSHVLWANNGGSYNKAWHFYNSGRLSCPDSTWYLEANGHLWGTGYGNQYLHQWATASFAPISDSKLKRNIKPSTKSALSDISKIDFVSYDWRDNNSLTKGFKSAKIGITAQQMENIDECYIRDINTYKEDGVTIEDSIKALDTTNVLALALKAIQELEAKVAELEEKLNVQ